VEWVVTRPKDLKEAFEISSKKIKGYKKLDIRKYCSGVWPTKCHQGSKTNKSNCQFWIKLIFD
jgi:hypothetical protein